VTGQLERDFPQQDRASVGSFERSNRFKPLKVPAPEVPNGWEAPSLKRRLGKPCTPETLKRTIDFVLSNAKMKPMITATKHRRHNGRTANN
jgi:hypothetical protein